MSHNVKRAISMLLACIMMVGVFIATPKMAKAAELDYSCVFNASFYSTKYADLKAVYGNDEAKLLNHFINYGMAEGRQGSEEFNVIVYKTRYADLQAVYGDDLQKYYIHYITYGKAEGRIGRAEGKDGRDFATTQTRKTNTEIPTDAIAFADGYFLPSLAPNIFSYICSERSAGKKAEVVWSDTLANNSRTRAREISIVYSDNRPNGDLCETAYEVKPIKELQMCFNGVVTVDDVVREIARNDYAHAFITRDEVLKCGISVYTEKNMSYVIVVFQCEEKKEDK